MQINNIRNQVVQGALVAIIAVLLPACTSVDSEEVAAGDKRECRTREGVASRLRSSVCMTVSEWAAIDAQAEEAEADDANVNALLRTSEEYRAQNPVSPGDTYNPFPAGF